MGKSYATDAKTIWQFRVMVPFDGSHPTTFTGRLKLLTISACWPMMHVSVWLPRYVRCSPSSIRTALTRVVLTTEVIDHPQRILCLVNAGFLLLVVGGAVPGASGTDVMIETSTDTYFTSSSIALHPLDLTLFYAGLYPLACIFL